ncbi:hypothetical protein AB837_00272 [bacterium AB1]|nr:hypothetical protein AB837_00272 [bacterium AB1]
MLFFLKEMGLDEKDLTFQDEKKVVFKSILKRKQNDCDDELEKKKICLSIVNKDLKEIPIDKKDYETREYYSAGCYRVFKHLEKPNQDYLKDCGYLSTSSSSSSSSSVLTSGENVVDYTNTPSTSSSICSKTVFVDDQLTEIKNIMLLRLKHESLLCGIFNPIIHILLYIGTMEITKTNLEESIEEHFQEKHYNSNYGKLCYKCNKKIKHAFLNFPRYRQTVHENKVKSLMKTSPFQLSHYHSANCYSEIAVNDCNFLSYGQNNKIILYGLEQNLQPKNGVHKIEKNINFDKLVRGNFPLYRDLLYADMFKSIKSGTYYANLQGCYNLRKLKYENIEFVQSLEFKMPEVSECTFLDYLSSTLSDGEKKLIRDMDECSEQLLFVLKSSVYDVHTRLVIVHGDQSVFDLKKRLDNVLSYIPKHLLTLKTLKSIDCCFKKSLSQCFQLEDGTIVSPDNHVEDIIHGIISLLYLISCNMKDGYSLACNWKLVLNNQLYALFLYRVLYNVCFVNSEKAILSCSHDETLMTRSGLNYGFVYSHIKDVDAFIYIQNNLYGNVLDIKMIDGLYGEKTTRDTSEAHEKYMQSKLQYGKRVQKNKMLSYTYKTFVKNS